jgi:phage terminase small subunit
MPVLKNAKHELFSQALAKGLPAIHPYEAAGYKPDRGAACRLCQRSRSPQ